MRRSEGGWWYYVRLRSPCRKREREELEDSIFNGVVIIRLEDGPTEKRLGVVGMTRFYRVHSLPKEFLLEVNRGSY